MLRLLNFRCSFCSNSLDETHMYAPDQTPRAWFDDFLATILPVELLPQDYIRDVVLGDDHMEPHELKLYG